MPRDATMTIAPQVCGKLGHPACARRVPNTRAPRAVDATRASLLLVCHVTTRNLMGDHDTLVPWEELEAILEADDDDDEEEKESADDVAKKIHRIWAAQAESTVLRRDATLEALHYPDEVCRDLQRAKDVMRAYAPLYAMEAQRGVDRATCLLARHASDKEQRKRQAAVDAAVALERLLDEQEHPLLTFSERQKWGRMEKKKRRRRKRMGGDNLRKTP